MHCVPQISGSLIGSSQDLVHVVESVHFAIEADAAPESKSAEIVPLKLYLSRQDEPDTSNARSILLRHPTRRLRVTKPLETGFLDLHPRYVPSNVQLDW